MRIDERTLGQIGYETYGEDAGWVSFDGQPLPSWDNLRSDLQTRWEIMTKAIATEALKRSTRTTGVHRRVQTG